MVGQYKIKVETQFPQKIISGFGNAFEGLTGASYTPIAYLGSQVVNGLNHAYLAYQNLITASDIKSICLVILNEKPGDVRGDTFSIVEIKKLLSDGGKNLLGGINITPTTEIPEEAMKVFNDHFGGFLGANNTPFALLATQIVNGIAYYFAVDSKMFVSPMDGEVSVMTANLTESINIVKIFSNYSEIQTKEVLKGQSADVDVEENTNLKNTAGYYLNKASAEAVGYAFTW